MGFTIMGSFMDKLRVRSTPGKGHDRHYAEIHMPPDEPAMSGDIYDAIRLAKQGDRDAAGAAGRGEFRTYLERRAPVLRTRRRPG